jgi:hypothetical protein
MDATVFLKCQKSSLTPGPFTSLCFAVKTLNGFVRCINFFYFFFRFFLKAWITNKAVRMPDVGQISISLGYFFL